MPERHPALDSGDRRVDSEPVSAATAISAQTISSARRPTSVEMRKPMPTIGVPKNSATIAPIRASVELIFSALKTKGMAAGSRSFNSVSTSSRAIAAHQVALEVAGGGEPRDRVHQHREEGHDHDDGGLRVPVEAEPHDHDRGDADDRQRGDEIAERQQPALQERHAVAEDRGEEPAPQPMSQPGITARTKVCTKSAQSVGSEAMSLAPMSDGAGSSTSGTPKP